MNLRSLINKTAETIWCMRYAKAFRQYLELKGTSMWVVSWDSAKESLHELEYDLTHDPKEEAEEAASYWGDDQ
jgi:hypothetical protein